jgi:hypothetical protein
MEKELKEKWQFIVSKILHPSARALSEAHHLGFGKFFQGVASIEDQ